MIAWINPGALLLLAAVGAPVLIHWLLRRRAVRRAFPTVRFLTATQRSAVRLYRPSDVALLVLRMAIVACAALAIAQPLITTTGRRESWGARLTRAVVVDTSVSVNRERAAEAAETASRGVNAWRRFDAPTLGPAVERAAAWLRGAQPGRQEIAIVSDFQRGAITHADVARVPQAVGLRMLRVEGVAVKPESFDADAVLAGDTTYARLVFVDQDSTAVTLRPTAKTDGLEIDASSGSIERLRRAVADAGAVAPSSAQPIVLRFGTGSTKGDGTLDGWTRDAAFRLFAAPETKGLQIRAASQDRALMLDVNVPADSLDAARVLQAALNTRQDSAAWADREPSVIAVSTLASWTREPRAPEPEAWQRSTESDGRWLWVAAMLLMGLESVVRREPRQAAAPSEAHAA